MAVFKRKKDSMRSSIENTIEEKISSELRLFTEYKFIDELVEKVGGTSVPFYIWLMNSRV